MQVQEQSPLLGDPQLKGKEELQVIFSWMTLQGGRSGCCPHLKASLLPGFPSKCYLHTNVHMLFGQKNNSSISQIKSNKKGSRFVLNRILQSEK